MQAKGIPAGEAGVEAAVFEPAEAEAAADSEVIALLLGSEGPGLWAIDELVREVGARVQVADSLSRLVRAGLAHESNGFVLASRSAVVFEQIAL